MKLLLYCNREKPYLKRYWDGWDGSYYGAPLNKNACNSFCLDYKLNGKIIAECDFNIEGATIHIENLQIFDKPIELKEFAYENNKMILNLNSQELCNILNGEQKIITLEEIKNE